MNLLYLPIKEVGLVLGNVNAFPELVAFVFIHLDAIDTGSGEAFFSRYENKKRENGQANRKDPL